MNQTSTPPLHRHRAWLQLVAAGPGPRRDESSGVVDCRPGTWLDSALVVSLSCASLSGSLMVHFRCGATGCGQFSLRVGCGCWVGTSSEICGLYPLLTLGVYSLRRTQKAWCRGIPLNYPLSAVCFAACVNSDFLGFISIHK